MLTARTSNKEKVIASQVTKLDGPFHCCECSSELRLRKCRIKVDHFAHIPPTQCIYGSGESQQHLECKISIYQELLKRKNVDKLEIERSLKGLRPDISFRVNQKQHVGIEVQISKLDIAEIERRTKRYLELNIYVCWIFLFDSKINNDRLSPKFLEKWVHALNYGRVYYWTSGCSLIPVHFSDHYLEVPYNSYYTSEGEECSSGGYLKKSKKYREPRLHASVDMIDDFIGKTRDPFKIESIELPLAKIWHDKLNKWWSEKSP